MMSGAMDGTMSGAMDVAMDGSMDVGEGSGMGGEKCGRHESAESVKNAKSAAGAKVRQV
jgi:hypothetical protein